MKYIEVIPEVIVGLGEKTNFKEKQAPFQTVTKLHILLEDWLGDDLMECHPCYIVTDQLRNALEVSKFTGFVFLEMEVTKDEYFDNNYQLKKPIPKFHWLKIIGNENIDDIYSSKRLMLSESIYNWLKNNFTVNYLSDDNKDVDDFMQRFMESQKNK